ncbi:hypothetical protein OIU84_003187 [Salix udensis]|uniref:Uncharacterized protein n=1 Tax=Salix udensis TaxID=889485 RepID=A0AAD6P659_9ROSI|nr:hypothetical protein OIU84_003187 [Salix udensis]
MPFKVAAPKLMIPLRLCRWVSDEECHAVSAIDLQQVFKQDMNHANLLVFPESPHPIDLQKPSKNKDRCRQQRKFALVLKMALLVEDMRSWADMRLISMMIALRREDVFMLRLEMNRMHELGFLFGELR